MITTEFALKLGEFSNLCKTNRVFPKCDFISMFEQEMPNMEIRVPKGHIMYRARVYSNNWIDKLMEITEHVHKSTDVGSIDMLKMKSKNLKCEWEEKNNRGFHGYDEEASFVNKHWKNIGSGRCNHEYESCLYTAEDIETAISELKPLIKENISVAEVKALEELRVIDVCIDFSSRDNQMQNAIGVFFLISPTETRKDAYIYTQIICSIVKQHGYDGIRYSSCQNSQKKNYAIFNYEKCKAISSEVYSIRKIEYTYEKNT